MTDEPYLGDLAAAAAGNGDGQVLAALAVLSSELGETRAHVDELRQHLDSVLAELGRLRDQAAIPSALADEVTALAEAVQELTDTGGSGPPKPLDLAHVPAEEMQRVLGELVEWVRETLFRGWPWTQTRLRECWLLHPELVNAMLWIRTAYLTAYQHKDRRVHHAADFHHWLEETMRLAAEHTKDCPRRGTATPHVVPLPPRDDVPMLGEIEKLELLAQMHRQMQIANAEDVPEHARQAAREVVAELTDHVSKDDFRRYVEALDHTKRAAAPKPAQQRRPPGRR